MDADKDCIGRIWLLRADYHIEINQMTKERRGFSSKYWHDHSKNNQLHFLTESDKQHISNIKKLIENLRVSGA